MRKRNNQQNIIVWNDLTIFLPSAIVCKITTEEVENIVLDFNSKFRQYYGENFNAAYYKNRAEKDTRSLASCMNRLS